RPPGRLAQAPWPGGAAHHRTRAAPGRAERLRPGRRATEAPAGGGRRVLQAPLPPEPAGGGHGLGRLQRRGRAGGEPRRPKRRERPLWRARRRTGPCLPRGLGAHRAGGAQLSAVRVRSAAAQRSARPPPVRLSRWVWGAVEPRQQHRVATYEDTMTHADDADDAAARLSRLEERVRALEAEATLCRGRVQTLERLLTRISQLYGDMDEELAAADFVMEVAVPLAEARRLLGRDPATGTRTRSARQR